MQSILKDFEVRPQSKQHNFKTITFHHSTNLHFVSISKCGMRTSINDFSNQREFDEEEISLMNRHFFDEIDKQPQNEN